MTAQDPRIARLVRARYEVDYEAWHKRPCPRWSGPPKKDQAAMEREAELWLPAFERASLMPREGDDQPVLCGACLCSDCGGPFAQHHYQGLCECGCQPACERFDKDSRLELLRATVHPLTGDLLDEAVAHAAWHALFAPIEETEHV